MIKKYKKKPVVVEAVLYDGTEESEDICLEFIGDDADVGMTKDTSFIIINTLEGRMEADIGDYIIKGIEGEFYTCKPETFKKNYEKVS